LATVIDCFNKEVIGYAMASHMRTELVTDALDMAAHNHPLAKGCIMHSDRGSQYTSTAYLAKLAELGLSPSLGRTGVCFEVSRRRESHPPPLAEPCVKVALHTAPTVEPVGIAPCRQ
jgi:transposase InsO family protein